MRLLSALRKAGTLQPEDSADALADKFLERHLSYPACDIKSFSVTALSQLTDDRQGFVVQGRFRLFWNALRSLEIVSSPSTHMV